MTRKSNDYAESTRGAGSQTTNKFWASLTNTRRKTDAEKAAWAKAHGYGR